MVPIGLIHKGSLPIHFIVYQEEQRSVPGDRDRTVGIEYVTSGIFQTPTYILSKFFTSYAQ